MGVVCSFTVMTTDSGHRLEAAEDQSPNGSQLVERRGHLYLYPKDVDDYIVSSVKFPNLIPVFYFVGSHAVIHPGKSSNLIKDLLLELQADQAG